MIDWAYQRGRMSARRCSGDHLGIMGNPSNAKAEVVASFDQGYRDEKAGLPK